MKRILITRPRSQADEFAAAVSTAGFEPVFFPVIEIRPFEDTTIIDRALKKLSCYDWVIFTSVNGVEVFWSRMKAVGITDFPRKVHVAAIGPKTAEALTLRGARTDFVPKQYVAEAILPGLGDIQGRWILLPRAEIARKALPDAISKAGGIAHEVAIYRTLPAQTDKQTLGQLSLGIDAITFTSSSTVLNFLAIVRSGGLDPLNLPGHPLVACIGPITASTAQEEGFFVDLVADEYTSEGLVKLLSSQVKR